jgi:mannobiose 2-epimerase
MPAPISSLADLRRAAHAELTGDILPYWVRYGFEPDSGRMTGMITCRGERVDDVPRHVVICARTLWTFAAALRQLGPEGSWRRAGELARAQLLGPFWDRRHGGVFWSIDAAGQVNATRKQGYAQAFAIYGLAEWHAASGDPEALARAQELFTLLERHTHDAEHGGYLEARSAEWAPLADLRLSEVELNVPKTMNTLLHLLEAYTSLLRVWPDGGVRRRLAELVGLFLDHVYSADPAPHCQLFFERDWRAVEPAVASFGHDIEASWLLCEAAAALGEDAPAARVQAVARALAGTVLDVAVDADGGIFYEARAGRLTNTDKHWWPQAEAVVGFLNAGALTGDRRYETAALRCWQFIEDRIIDRELGEWRPGVDRAGRPKGAYPEFRDGYKIGPWKCPYHNGRACLEVLRRIPA